MWRCWNCDECNYILYIKQTFLLNKTKVMNVEQNKEVGTQFQNIYIEVYLLRSKVLGHKFRLQLQPSSLALDVKVLFQFCCVFSESHRKKISFWIESWVWDFNSSWHRPSPKIVDSVAPVLSCALWCPIENTFFCVFFHLFTIHHFFVCVCVCVVMVWITFGMSSEVGSPFQETQYSFSREVPVFFFTLLLFAL